LALPPPTLEAVASFDNLYLAWRKAAQHKTRRFDVAVFGMQWEGRLARLAQALKDGSYRPGNYRVFTMHEKKTRTIMAAPFIDRVVHHAVCNVVTPVLECSISPHSCANRLGMGTRRGLELFGRFAYNHRYVLKCDIRQFFPSIDRTIMLQLLTRKVRDERLLELLRLVLFAAPESEGGANNFPGDDLFTPLDRGRGLPIGNMTSQTWANWYLNGLDHYVMDYRGFGAYVRYVDDFAVFGDDKTALLILKQDIEKYLAGLRMVLHADKSRVYHTADGVPFLGFRHYRGYRMLQKPNVRRFRRRVRGLTRAGAHPEHIRASVAGWAGFARLGNTMRLREKLYDKYQRMMHIKGQGATVPRVAWGLVEQQCKQSSFREPQQQQSEQPEQQYRFSCCESPA
jgi:hypothetical protein